MKIHGMENTGLTRGEKFKLLFGLVAFLGVASVIGSALEEPAYDGPTYVKSGALVCDESSPIQRVRHATEERAFARIAMTESCMRMDGNTEIEVLGYNEYYDVIKFSQYGADRYVRAKDVVR